MDHQTDSNQLKAQWVSFLDKVYPHRPALFRYCLSLTRNPFDADDLVSETIIKTFTSQAYVTDGIDSYIAFMIRTASRTWIDGQRRATYPVVDQSDSDNHSEDLKILTEAAEALYVRFNPTERAVLVLKEVFEMSHKEIANVLAISPEASRVILHRSKNVEPNLVHRQPRVSKELAQRFVDGFLTHDIEQVRSLLLDDMETVVFPMGIDLQPKDSLSWLEVAFKRMPDDLCVCKLLGDNAILTFRNASGSNNPRLETVWLLEESEGWVSRITGYGATRDLLEWVEGYLVL
jgi:RNA polymerase sigma factor (sigma-70 family)